MIAVGRDILRIARIEAVQEYLGERFVRRILTPPSGPGTGRVGLVPASCRSRCRANFAILAP